MKTCTALMFAVLLTFAVGCGGVDSSQATPEVAPEEIINEIEQAAESGAIDPATYGQE